ncbi:MAG: glucosaminidase domain-containing protein [Pseudomonadota bacterium]|nr:glucosaminidase domain-containing protein [Pseudomonadota bacterium]
MKNSRSLILLAGLLVWSGVLVVLPNSAMAAKISTEKSKSESAIKKEFVGQVKDMAISKNKQVLAEKKSLSRFQKLLKSGQSLSAKDKLWLQKLAVKYQMNTLAHKSATKWTDKEWKEFDEKVDIVPVSIIVAQAVHESNFGRSNLAKQGNNLFGQKTPKTGYAIKCGTTTKTFKIYKSQKESVNSYVDNINGCYAYREFRSARIECRNSKRCLEGGALMEYIGARYAEDKSYTQNVKRLMNQYHMKEFDHLI